MRKVIINMIAYGIMGAVMAKCGKAFSTWEFWVIMACLVIVQVNSSF